MKALLVLLCVGALGLPGLVAGVSSLSSGAAAHQSSAPRGMQWLASVQASRLRTPEWIAKVQHSADVATSGAVRSIVRSQSVFSTHGGCFQCTRECHTPSCAQCFAYSHGVEDVQMSGFCENGGTETSFRGGSSASCGNCTCCQFVRRASCDFVDSVCREEPSLSAYCDTQSDKLVQLAQQDTRCAHFLEAVQSGNFSRACGSACFEPFMTAYAAMYNASCLQEDALSPLAMSNVLCGRACVPPQPCFDLANRLVEEVDADASCSQTLDALASGNMTRGLCLGQCYSNLAHTYEQLWTRGCFACDASVLSPMNYNASNCNAPAPDNTVVVVHSVTAGTCAQLHNATIAPLVEDHTCSWLFSALQARKYDGVCDSPCFVRYVEAYERMYDSGCGVDEHAPAPSAFQRRVCQLDTSTWPTRASPGAKVATIRAGVLLSLPTISASGFQRVYGAAFEATLARLAHVPLHAVRIVSVDEGLRVEFALTVAISAARNTENDLRIALEGPLLADGFSQVLRNMSAGLYVASVPVVQPVSVSVDSECESLHRKVGGLCFGRDACPAAVPSQECCDGLLEAMSASCDDKAACGRTMAAYHFSSCPVLQDVVGEIHEWYENNPSPSPSERPLPTPSPSAQPSSTPSNTPSPSVSPVHVFRVDEFPRGGGFAQPMPPYAYWGVRQTCHAEDERTNCSCVYGYTGHYCETSVFENCPLQCSDRGNNCTNGVCQCKLGFTGSSCAVVTGCSNDSYCSGHGYCHCSAVSCHCLCDTGYSGARCEVADFGCPKRCSAHGKCLPNATCRCDAGYTGRDCSVLATGCPLNCSGHGVCNPALRTCACHVGFGGHACEFANSTHIARVCRGCTGRGLCNVTAGRCVCDPGFFGAFCEHTRWKFTCSDRSYCSGHGVCNPDTGECACAPGFTGDSCGIPVGCPNHCSGNGRCIGPPGNETCKCRMAWTGANCSVSRCPTGTSGMPCSQNGVCEKKLGVSQCTCSEGFSGTACEVAEATPTPEPPQPVAEEGAAPAVECGGNGCSDNGVCLGSGACDCFEGFEGADCSQPSAPAGGEDQGQQPPQ